MKLESGNIGSFFEPFASFIKRFHTILFFLIVSLGLGFAIFVLLNIINESSRGAASGTNMVNATFDTETIDRINKLGQETPSSAGKRPNPFVEN